jgi:hypothetical protein
MAMANELPPPMDEPRAPAVVGITELLERAVLLLLFACLVLGILTVLRPFATAILFGTILAIAAWPLRDLLLRRGLKRGLVATLLLLLALAVIAVPLMAMAPGLGDRLTQGAGKLQDYFASSPQLPSWLAGLPVVGERLAKAWVKVLVAKGGSGPRSNPIPTSCGRVWSRLLVRSARVSCRSSYRWWWRRSSGSAATRWRRRCATSCGGLVVKPPAPNWMSRRARCAVWPMGSWGQPPSRPS